jgi:hypothetical protein
MGVSFLVVNFACPVKYRVNFTGVLFVAKLFSSRHNGTKTLKKNNKMKHPAAPLGEISASLRQAAGY